MAKRYLALVAIALGFLRPVTAGAETCATSGPNDGKVDPHLLGTWRPRYYVLDGVKHPLRGLMIITPHYFMANVVIVDGSGVSGANANSGPYVIQCSKLVLTQWMQLHYRPQTPDKNLLTEGIPEAIDYEATADTLTFTFPSGNSYVSKREAGD